MFIKYFENVFNVVKDLLNSHKTDPTPSGQVGITKPEPPFVIADSDFALKNMKLLFGTFFLYSR